MAVRDDPRSSTYRVALRRATRAVVAVTLAASAGVLAPGKAFADDPIFQIP